MTSSTFTSEHALGGLFSIEVLDSRSGFVSFRVSGTAAEKLFQNEAGGHRWQRVPPTEKRGRRQTSTVTVAVLTESGSQGFELDESDLEWDTMRGSGPGGQHRNKTDSCVVLKHVPTGLTVRIDSKSQHRNRELALKVMKARLFQREQEERSSKENDIRQDQLGSGMRGDKRRTYREQDDRVVDHMTGKRASLKRVRRGEIELLGGNDG